MGSVESALAWLRPFRVDPAIGCTTHSRCWRAQFWHRSPSPTGGRHLIFLLRQYTTRQKLCRVGMRYSMQLRSVDIPIGFEVFRWRLYFGPHQVPNRSSVPVMAHKTGRGLVVREESLCPMRLEPSLQNRRKAVPSRWDTSCNSLCQNKLTGNAEEVQKLCCWEAKAETNTKCLWVTQARPKSGTGCRAGKSMNQGLQGFLGDVVLSQLVRYGGTGSEAIDRLWTLGLWSWGERCSRQSELDRMAR